MLCTITRGVIAAGGGFVGPKFQGYTFIYLKAPLELILNRVDLNAPYLAYYGNLFQLAKVREPLYQSLCDLEVPLYDEDIEASFGRLWQAIQ